MRSHRAILAKALKDKGLSHKAIASAMGWKSAGSVGHKLSGRRDWSEGELARMTELAGMTIIELAASSDDMPGFSKRKGTAEGASILDNMTDAQFEAAMQVLRAMSPPK